MKKKKKYRKIIKKKDTLIQGGSTLQPHRQKIMGCYSGGVEKVIFIKYVTIRKKKLRILLHSMEEISFSQ